MNMRYRFRLITVSATYRRNCWLGATHTNKVIGLATRLAYLTFGEIGTVLVRPCESTVTALS